MKHLQHLSAEENLQRLTYRNTLNNTEAIEKFATWLITGLAAILGAMIVNSEAVSKAITSSCFSWGLTFLVISLLLGVISKQVGAALLSGLSVLDELYNKIESPEWQAVLQECSDSTEEFGLKLISPFSFPISFIMHRAFKNGSKDKLAAEKRLIKLFCILIYLSWGQSILGALGLLTFAIGIK